MLKRTLVLGLIICFSQITIAQKWLPVKGNTKSSTVLPIANSADKIALISSEKGLLFQEFNVLGKNTFSKYLSFDGFGKYLSVFNDGFYINDKVVFSIEGSAKVKYIPGIVIVDSENSSYNYIDFDNNKYIHKGYKIAKFKDKIAVAFTTIDKKLMIFILDEDLTIENRFEKRI